MQWLKAFCIICEYLYLDLAVFFLVSARLSSYLISYKLQLMKIKEMNVANYILPNKYLINWPLNKFKTKL